MGEVKMYKTIDGILNEIENYRSCEICNSINWYENKKCFSCKEESVYFLDKGISSQRIISYFDRRYPDKNERWVQMRV